MADATHCSNPDKEMKSTTSSQNEEDKATGILASVLQEVAANSEYNVCADTGLTFGRDWSK